MRATIKSVIISSLFEFALKDLFVIRNTHSGVISANFVLPMAFRIENDNIGAKGDFAVPLTEPILVDEERKNSGMGNGKCLDDAGRISFYDDGTGYIEK